MEGYALLLCFRLGLIRASSYRPNQNHTTTFILKVTILPKAINRNKPFCPGDVAVRHRTGVYPCLSPCDGCKDPKG